MWNGYCGQMIRRTNRNLLIVIVGVAASVALLIYANRQYLRQFFHGPSTVEPAAIVLHPVEDQFVRPAWLANTFSWQNFCHYWLDIENRCPVDRIELGKKSLVPSTGTTLEIVLPWRLG